MDMRTALLIDGANMFAASRELHFLIDYAKLLELFGREYDIVRANYYTAVRSRDDNQNQIIKLIDWLSYNGYKVVTKPAIEYHSVERGSFIKGNMDVRMAVDAMVMSDSIDHYILGTGDGDFVDLVDALQAKGRRVSALSTIACNPPMIATALRKEVDQFYELNDLRKLIERDRDL